MSYVRIAHAVRLMLEKNKLEKQFLEAYDKHSDAIFRYCYYRVFDREKAKDFVQEAYTRAWKYISAGKEVEDMKSFVYKIAHNLIIDDSRKKKAVSLEYIAEKGFHPSVDNRQKNENAIFGKEMIEMVKLLEEKYSQVIMLKYVNELTISEIAEVLGETENNISVRLNRGFKQIKEILEKKEKSL